MERISNASPEGDGPDAAGPSSLLAPGTCVEGKYIICDVLGEGGSAIVYAAEQVGLRRVVAFKLYPLRSGMAPIWVERFQREAHLLAQVRHVNVLAVYDSGTLADGSPFLVVQRLRGDSLASRLRAGPLPVPEVVDLARQILSALSALGDIGITHRDVKPDNLMFDTLYDGSSVLKLVDFGVAKVAQRDRRAPGVPDELVGTPHYMSPEQMRGEDVDARCDLYALGVTLYEMLTGRTPHTGETLNDIALAILYGPITPVRELRRDCPQGLEQIVMKALARDPADRFASAGDMRDALEGWEALHLGLPARAPQVVPPPEPAPARPPRPAVAIEAAPPGRGPRPSPPASRSRVRADRRATKRLRDAYPPVPRGVARGLRLSMLAAATAASSWALFHQVRLHHDGGIARQASSRTLETSGSSLEAVAQAGASALELMTQTSASAGEWLIWARHAAQELLGDAGDSAHELLLVTRDSVRALLIEAPAAEVGAYDDEGSEQLARDPLETALEQDADMLPSEAPASAQAAPDPSITGWSLDPDHAGVRP